MRTWIAGLLCAVLGGYAAWIGFAEAAWLFMLGGMMLLIASLAHIVRPGTRSLGAMEICWGALIIGYFFKTGQALSFESARSAGRSMGFVFGGVLVIAGLWNLTRPIRATDRAEA